MSPAPQEQLDHINDYSNISGLHVYGDLLNELYNLNVDASLSTAGRLFNAIRLLDRALFIVYCAFVLSKLGYDVKSLANDQTTQIYTSKFDLTDWTSLSDLYRENLAEGAESSRWVEDFVKGNSRIRVVFMDTFFTGDIADINGLLASDSRNLVVVHPRSVRQVSGVFRRFKRELREAKSESEFVSTGEFLALFAPETAQRKIVESEWQAILDDILNTLIRSWPIIGAYRHRKLLDESKEYVRLSRAKYEMGQTRDAMRDACLACEGILTVMVRMFEPTKVEDNAMMADLLETLRQYIVSEFGEDIYRDLDFVREWRNRASHVGRENPTQSDVLKVLTKVELFMNLFEERLSIGTPK